MNVHGAVNAAADVEIPTFEEYNWETDYRNLINNIQNKIGVRNMTNDGEQLGYQRSVTPTLPRSGGISFTYKFGAY